MLQIKFCPSFKQKHHSESDLTTQLLCSLQIQVVAPTYSMCSRLQSISSYWHKFANAEKRVSPVLQHFE